MTDLDQIRARLNAVTPGEAWNIPNVDYTDADVELIVNAPSDMAYLLEEARKARRWAYLWKQEAQIQRATTKDLSRMWRVLYRRCEEQEVQIETLEARVAELAKKNKRLMEMGFDRFDQSQ